MQVAGPLQRHEPGSRAWRIGHRLTDHGHDCGKETGWESVFVRTEDHARNRRGLRGVKLVISDSHEGIKAAVAKVLKATWQRCRVHFMRNALAHAGKTQRRMVAAAIGTVFVQDTAEAARTQWRTVADQLRERFPKLGALMADAEHDVLAFMTFPKAHWSQLYSTNPLERLNAEIKRRTNVVGIFPNDASITRLIGAMMLEQNDEWSLNRRYMQLEGLQTLCDTAPTRLSAVAR